MCESTDTKVQQWPLVITVTRPTIIALLDVRCSTDCRRFNQHS